MTRFLHPALNHFRIFLNQPRRGEVGKGPSLARRPIKFPRRIQTDDFRSPRSMVRPSRVPRVYSPRLIWPMSHPSRWPSSLLLPSRRQSRDKIVRGCLREKIPAVLLARDGLHLALRFARGIVPNASRSRVDQKISCRGNEEPKVAADRGMRGLTGRSPQEVVARIESSSPGQRQLLTCFFF
jgi:hypothetical protein